MRKSIHLDGDTISSQLYKEYDAINTARMNLNNEESITIDLIYHYNNTTETLSILAESSSLWVTKFGTSAGWMEFGKINIGRLNYEDSDKAIINRDAISSQLHNLFAYIGGAHNMSKAELRKSYLIAVFLASEAVRTSACRQCVIQCMTNGDEYAESVEAWNQWENYSFLCNNWRHASVTVFGQDSPYSYVTTFEVEKWVEQQEKLSEDERDEGFGLMQRYVNQYRNVLAQYIDVP